MKKPILLWIFFVISQFAYSQVITVKDQVTGKPVEQVTFMSEKPNMFVTTNIKGQVDISGFIGSKSIEIRSLGYKTEVMSYSELEQLTFELKLIPVSINLGEVVVSATRWDQSSENIPSRIISITPGQVELQNPQTAADMLGISGEVFIQKSQQGGGSPMIRGFATNRLLYTIDGIRMNTAIFRAGNIQNVISLDPLAIEHTEVFFGPGSVIYGSDAIGGVMSFQTLTPQLSYNGKPLINGKAEVRYASANNEITGHFDVGVGWKKFAMISSITSYNYGDLRMGSYGPSSYLCPYYVQRQDSTDVIVSNKNPKIQKPSAYSQINMMQKLRYMPNEHWDIQYGFHYSETSEYDRYDRLIRYKNGLLRYGEWYYGPQKWMMNNLTVSNSSHNIIYDQLTLRLAQQFFEESRVSRDINKANREIRTEKVYAYSANLDFVKTIGKKNVLYYGLEYVFNDVFSKGLDQDIVTGTEAPGPARYPESDWASYAAYISGQFMFTEKVILQAGVRYNQYQLKANFDTSFYHFPFVESGMNNGAVTGSIGLVVKPGAQWILSIGASTGFRSPNVDDMGKVFDSEPGSVVVPNPGLKAEYAYNGELGVAKMFSDFLKFDVSVYYTYLQNAMVRRDYTLNGTDSIMYDGTMSKVQAVQNAAFANVYGFQAGIEVKLPAGFGFISDFNYQKGIEELDDGSKSPSRHAPPWFGVSRLTFSTDRLNMQIYAVYSGEKKFNDMPEEERGKTEIYATDADGNPYSPGWYTLNFKAMYQVIPNLSVSAGVENITDQRYRPYSSGLVAAGRNFVLSLRANF